MTERHAFLKAIETEMAAQRLQLQECHNRLAELEHLRNRYLFDTAGDPSDKAHANRPARKRASLNTIVRNTVADFLRGQVDPVPTAKIFDHLASHGIRLGGGNPKRFLSVLLSRAGIFVAHGHQGWTLSEP
ncbi:MAG: hypothetical protein AB7K04_03475 [Pseudorhodoplanes sp.]